MSVLLLDRVLALAEGVPELDGFVSGAGDDLAVVHGESDGEDVLAVAHEPAGGGTRVEVPEAKGAVPRAGKRELPITGDDHVLHEVAVAAEGPLGEAVLAFLAGQVPQNDSLVTGRGQEDVGVVDGGRNGSDPAFVPVFFMETT